MGHCSGAAGIKDRWFPIISRSLSSRVYVVGLSNSLHQQRWRHQPATVQPNSFWSLIHTCYGRRNWHLFVVT